MDNNESFDNTSDIQIIEPSENATTKRASFSIANHSDISTSILECPWILPVPSDYTPVSAGPKIQIEKVLPAFHDPLFSGYIFLIPSLLKNLFTATEIVPFKYLLHEELSEIVIKKEVPNCTTNVYKIPVYQYGSTVPGEFTAEIPYKLVFFVGRKKYTQRVKSKDAKLYQQCLVDKTRYTKNTEPEIYKEDLLKSQIDFKYNLCYIESFADLVSNFKALLRSFDGKKASVPKVRTFNGQMKTEYLEYVLKSLHGIGGNMAKQISERFVNVKSFIEYLFCNDLLN